MTSAAGGPLAGKVAVVTGSTRGIGRGIAERLADDGAAVLVSFVADSSASLADEVVDGVRATGGRAAAFQGDVSDPATAQALVSAAVEQLGGLDILVNNAAISDYQPFGSFSAQDVQRTLAVNVTAPFLLSQAAAAVMPDGGRIIHIGSTVATRMAREEGSLYATSKAALIGMTKGMARDLGARRITVNLVNPGPTATEMLARHSEEKIAHMVSFMAIKELARPEHTAAIVAALARDDAAYTTGAVIGVDGGYTI